MYNRFVFLIRKKYMGNTRLKSGTIKNHLSSTGRLSFNDKLEKLFYSKIFYLNWKQNANRTHFIH